MPPLPFPSGVVHMPVIVFNENSASCLHEDESYNTMKPHCFVLFLFSCKWLSRDGGRTSFSLEKSQLGLLVHLLRMPRGRLSQQEFLAHPARKWPRGPPRRFHLPWPGNTWVPSFRSDCMDFRFLGHDCWRTKVLRFQTGGQSND